jgi:hypothetical protein
MIFPAVTLDLFQGSPCRAFNPSPFVSSAVETHAPETAFDTNGIRTDKPASEAETVAALKRVMG